MQSFQITLSSISDVKRFVDAATRVPCDIDVCSGRYTVNGKSIMGLFSIDLSEPVQVTFHGTEEEAAAFRAQLEDQTPSA